MEDIQELFGVGVMFLDQSSQSSGLRERIGVHGWDRNVIGLDSLGKSDDFGCRGLGGHWER